MVKKKKQSKRKVSSERVSRSWEKNELIKMVPVNQENNGFTKTDRKIVPT